ncbi:MAG: spore maturation protein [Bacteroidetes bacterium]|nr:spore maturation protein [Bacteroidota bacterium]
MQINYQLVGRCFFLPILLATFFSTMAGLLAVSFVQRINLLNRTILAYLGSATLAICGIIWYFNSLEPEAVERISKVSGTLVIFSIIITFILLGIRKKINVYETFIEGAKEGFQVAIKIIPYLVAILVAIGVFRVSGAMDYLVNGIGAFFSFLGVNTDFVDALPTAFMKPLSGSGARGMMVDAMTTFGPDSFVARLSGVFQGSTETTFYVLAVYYGAVNIKRTRHTLGCALFADLIGIIAAVFIAYIFFHS